MFAKGHVFSARSGASVQRVRGLDRFAQRRAAGAGAGAAGMPGASCRAAALACIVDTDIKVCPVPFLALAKSSPPSPRSSQKCPLSPLSPTLFAFSFDLRPYLASPRTKRGT